MNRFPAFLLLAGVIFATACDDQPTSPRPGQRPSFVIHDGTNEESTNKDVFFLPPLVSNPSTFFDAAFNPNLTSAVFRVCRVESGECGAIVATFGNVAGATGPIVISAQDQHYLALWHTGEMNLPDGLYRIEVFYDEPATGDAPAAWADVQVVSSGKLLKTIDDQTIGLLDGRTLPIKVRFETDCQSANCISQVITDAGNVDDPLILTSGDGALVFQPGWLPEGISAIRVTLQRHEPGPNNDCVGKAAYTGPGLVAQREACLEVTTDPVLVPGEETGIQRPAYIYVCTESDESDPYHEFLEIIKADNGRPLEALREVSHGRLAELGFQPNCEPPIEIGFGSHPLLRLASRGLRAITQPVIRLLEVKPLYAIDLGQGGEIGIFGGFSFFTLGVQASAEAIGETPETGTTGSLVSLSIAVTGLTSHPEGGEEPSSETGSAGLADIDVRFAITAGDGGLTDPNSEGETEPASAITVQTGSGEGAGIATVDLTLGSGTNVVTAVALVDGEPVTSTVTFTVEGTAPVLFGGSVAVFQDVDAFNNNGMNNGDNVRLVQNLIGFTGPGSRADGSQVVFDHGKDSFCGASPFTPCAGFSDLKTVVTAAEFEVVDVASSPTSSPLTALDPAVKVVFLVAPQTSYTVAEINALKLFAADGGRIVYLGDYCANEVAYCGGVDTQDALMNALGASISHVDGLFGTPEAIFIQSHEITAGMEFWQTAGVGALALGAGATALITFTDGEETRAIAAVAPVNLTPIEP